MKSEIFPHRPEKNPETLGEFQEYLRRYFHFHFTNSATIREIKNVLEWLKSDSPDVLNWEGADSFSTIFLSFHTGSPLMKMMQHKYDFPDRLLWFLETCTELEKTTEQFAYIKNVEDLKDKEKIILSLQRLLEDLPTQEQFEKWVVVRMTMIVLKPPKTDYGA